MIQLSKFGKEFINLFLKPENNIPKTTKQFAVVMAFGHKK